MSHTLSKANSRHSHVGNGRMDADEASDARKGMMSKETRSIMSDRHGDEGRRVRRARVGSQMVAKWKDMERERGWMDVENG